MKKRQYAPQFASDTSVMSVNNLLQTRPFQANINHDPQAPQAQREAETLPNSFDLTKIQYAFNPPTTALGQPLQAKLTIGQPNDKYEQEADRVAHAVVQQIDSTQTAESPPQTLAQRQEEAIQMKPLVQKKKVLEDGETSPDLEASINQARGSGQPLDVNLQRQMGQAMGADFSGVKVHTDNRADQLNRSIQAKAFTTGQDLFFSKGSYQPGSRGGQELIAHELTHVVQQAPVSKSAQSTVLAPKGLRATPISQQGKTGSIQRKFGMEFEMKVPYCTKSPSGAIIPTSRGKEDKAEHSSGVFRIEGDKTAGNPEKGGSPAARRDINTIAELVTNPIDEKTLKTEQDVAQHFTPLVEMGQQLALIANNRGGASKDLKEFPGFQSTGKDYVFAPSRASFAMDSKAYVQATFGVNLSGMNRMLEGIAELNEQGGLISASRMNAQSLRDSIITVDKVASTIPREEQFDEDSVAGYLTYISTIINAGKNVRNASDCAKNMVPLLNKAEMHAPHLGTPDMRKAMRQLVLDKTNVKDEATNLFDLGKADVSYKQTVKGLLDMMIPLDEAKEGSIKQGMLGEEWHTRKADEGKGQPLHRDAIVEARRVFDTVSGIGTGMRIHPDHWISVLQAYWKVLNDANR